MKKIILSLLVVMMTVLGIQAQTNDTIRDDGFAFSPAELTVNAGDTVVFVGTDFHPVLEVSEATYRQVKELLLLQEDLLFLQWKRKN